MTEYQARTNISAYPDTVFAYLSDVRNLPHYVDRMTEAEPADGERVDVTADLDGHVEQGEAWLRVDRQDRTLSWGSEGPNEYRGRVAVTERGLGATVAVTLWTTRASGPDVQDGLEKTVANVARLCQDEFG